MTLSLQEKTDLTRFFIIKPANPGRLKTRSGWENPTVGARSGSSGGDWDDRPPKSFDSNFLHDNFVEFGKQHSRYKAIFPPLFCHTRVMSIPLPLLQ